MKIAIVGCGAMGSVYAALLAAAGHEVWAIDSWAEHVEAMRTKGLRLEGASGDRTVRLNASTRAAETVLSKPGARVKLMVIPTNEELVVARETKRLLEAQKN